MGLGHGWPRRPLLEQSVDCHAVVGWLGQGSVVGAAAVCPWDARRDTH